MKIEKNQSIFPSLLGSSVSGVFEIGLFHPVDTIAKRLMNNSLKGKRFFIFCK